MKEKRRPCRNRSSEHVDTEGSWAISYGDMITLLLSFFVIYFSTDFNKQTDEKLGKKVETEIKKVEKDLVLAAAKLNQISLKDLPLKDGEEIPGNVDIRIYKTGKSFLIYFAGTSFFDSGKVDLREDTIEVLKGIVTRIEPFLGNYKLKVRAFTDNVKVKSNHRFRNNLELSALRAVATMQKLEENGVPRHRMEVAGYGPMGPKLLEFLKIDSENTNERKALSRSIMILLKRDEYEET